MIRKLLLKKNSTKNLSKVLNTFESTMENGAFAARSKRSILHNIFKYIVFQRCQKVLSWSKGLTLMKGLNPLYSEGFSYTY